MGNKIVGVIQAGGKGTRMLNYTADTIPKSMLEINGKKIIEYQISLLKENGIKNIVIIIGHLGEIIRGYFKNGEKQGVIIEYIYEQDLLGSAGSLYYLRNREESVFLYIYADIFVKMDLRRLIHYHQQKKAFATLVVHPNNHPYDSNLIVLDKGNRISEILDKELSDKESYDNIVNAGIFVLSREFIEMIKEPVFLDMEKDILKKVILCKDIYGYKTSEYIKDAGTPERFEEIKKAERKGIPDKKNLSKKQKCVFLDRDGTLNVYKGYISNIEQIELEENVASAIRMVNESGYLAILATNQPVVAMGLCEVNDVIKFHRRIAYLLGEQGAYLDDYVFCPHHPARGFPNEKLEYKIRCNCRKPNTGMIMEMAERYNIDLKASWIVGDTTRDIQTGINAGMHQVLVHTGEAGKDGKYNVKPELETENLYKAIEEILNNQNNHI